MRNQPQVLQFVVHCVPASPPGAEPLQRPEGFASPEVETVWRAYDGRKQKSRENRWSSRLPKWWTVLDRGNTDSRELLGAWTVSAELPVICGAGRRLLSNSDSGHEDGMVQRREFSSQPKRKRARRSSQRKSTHG